MSILPAEPHYYPATLWDSADADARRTWWVLHTRPRQEKSLARQLFQRGIPFYLPLETRSNRISGRLTHSYLPVFPSYLFLLATPEERITALSTNRIVRTIDVVTQHELWSDLRQVYRLLSSGAPIRPEQRLVPGSHVEIQTGPLAGLKGTVLTVASERRFVVRVDFIQQGVSILFDAVALQRIA